MGLKAVSGGSGGGGGGSGTVTSVSVVTANGVSGTVANPTTTPAITLTVSGLTPAYTAQTATYAILSTDTIVEATANSFTVTLPTAVGVTGKMYIIVNSGSGTLTVATTSAQTIGGLSPATLAQNHTMTIFSNGANWLLTA